MLKRCTVFVVMALPVSVFAEMPIVNTDLLKKDETTVSLAASLSRSESTQETTFGSSSYQGSAETEGQQFFFALGRGISDKLSVSVAGSYMEYEAEQTSTGPATVAQTQKSSGLADPSLGIEYKLLAADFPLVAGISISIPTSSDSAGQSGTTINGVTVSSVEEGDAGSGNTLVIPRLAGSMQKESNVFEWAVSAYLDDTKNTENAYQVQLGWLHCFNERTSVRMGGSIYQQNGPEANNMSVDDMLNFGASIALMHQPRSDLRFSLGYNHVFLDDLAARSADGVTRQHITDNVFQSVSLQMTYLID